MRQENKDFVSIFSLSNKSTGLELVSSVRQAVYMDLILQGLFQFLSQSSRESHKVQNQVER